MMLPRDFTATSCAPCSAARPMPVVREDDGSGLHQVAPADGRDIHHSTLRETAPPSPPRTHREQLQQPPRATQPPVDTRACPHATPGLDPPTARRVTRLMPPMQLHVVLQFHRAHDAHVISPDEVSAYRGCTSPSTLIEAVRTRGVMYVVGSRRRLRAVRVWCPTSWCRQMLRMAIV